MRPLTSGHEPFAEQHGELGLCLEHSRGDRLQSCAAWLSTRCSNFIAASSFGKWPRVRTARRSFEFKASMELVV